MNLWDRFFKKQQGNEEPEIVKTADIGGETYIIDGLNVKDLYENPLPGHRVIDLSSPDEIEKERDAIAGISLGSGIDDLVLELIEIGSKDGFVSSFEQDNTSEDGNESRARKIGRLLDQQGGFELMQKVWYRLQMKLNSDAMLTLDHVWDRVGKWMA